MLGTILGPLSVLVVTAFSATVPQPSQSSIVLPDASAVDSQAPIHGNASSNDSASANDLAISCDHRRGSGFKVTSCSNLFPLLRQGTDDWVFAERYSPLPYDVGLPFRIQSLDGKCYVEVLLRQGKASGRMSMDEFGTAAYTLFDVCVIHYGYGGVAEHVGGDNNLQVALGSLKPTVKCNKSTPGPDFVSCSDILSKIAVSKENVTFGRRAGPGVDIILPSYLLSSDSKCLAKIDSTTLATSTSTWYDIWQAVNSVAYMCIKQTHFGGKAFKIGSLSTMTIELLAETPGVGLANATLLNESSAEEALLMVPAGSQNLSSEEALPTPPSLLAPYRV